MTMKENERKKFGDKEKRRAGGCDIMKERERDEKRKERKRDEKRKERGRD